MNNRGSNRFNLKLSHLSLDDGNLDNPVPAYETIDNFTSPLSKNDQKKKDEEEIINILPSYQMYQSTISKNITPSTEDLRTEPPRYELTPQASQVSTGGSSGEYFASGGSGTSFPSSPDLPSSRRPFETSPHDDTVDDFTRWEDTILANSHKLKRLPSINKEVSRLITVKIHLTEHIGKIGIPPNILDPLSVEFKQGDCIYGFVTVTNNTENPIPFDMFSVVLEGSITFGDNHLSTMNQQPQMRKFLNMFDFNASWNDGCLDRLTTDHNNPHFIYGNIIDPIDGTYTQLDHRKIFEPYKTYKKFFTFRLPEKLLDSSCEHGFVKHLQIPQTLGTSKNEIISNLRQKWKDGNYDSHSYSHSHLHSNPLSQTHSRTNSHTNSAVTSPALSPYQSPSHSTLPSTNNSSDHLSALPSKVDELMKHESHKQKQKYSSITQDFAFPDASISYCIGARVIGKASEYESLFMKNSHPHLNPEHDEYVVANEDNAYLRAIFTTHSSFELNRSMINEEARLIYANMVNKINNKIALGRELSSRPSDERTPYSSEGNSLHSSSSFSSLHPTLSGAELSKMQQSYYTKIRNLDRETHADHRENVYEVFLPYKKKTIIGSSKVIGLAALSTPKTEYMINYFPLPQFRNPEGPLPNTKVTIPFDLTFLYTDGHHHTVPDFRKISVELVALTIKSRSIPIPVVFHPDMLFENKSRGIDNFDMVTIKKFQKYAGELSKLMKEVGPESLELDRDIFLDIKSLANLASKYDHLKIPNCSVSKPHSHDCVSHLNQLDWETESIKTTGHNGAIEEQLKFSKKFDLHVDIKDAVLNGPTPHDFCLVPDFQYCLMSRLYYLKVDLKCPNGDKVTIKIPLVLQRQRQLSEE